MKIKSIDKTEAYRNNITVNLTRICGDVEHIKDKVNENNEHLLHINGRLRKAENNITAIKTIGATLFSFLTVAVTLMGVLL